MNKAINIDDVANNFAVKKNFKKINFIGKGSFKHTYQVITSSNTIFALKILDPSKSSFIRSKREIEAMQKCNIPLIGKLRKYGTFVDSNQTKYIYLLEEFLDGGTLTQKMKQNGLSKKFIKNLAISLIKALDHLKTLNIVHRDIKPDNIMFRKNSAQPVLVDFGIVRDLSATPITKSWLNQGPCTPYFASPEQLNNDKELISWKTDQFCIGIVLSVCLTDQHPFNENGMQDNELIQAVSERHLCSESFKTKIKNLGFEGIIKMIDPWPIRRYSGINDLLEVFHKITV